MGLDAYLEERLAQIVVEREEVLARLDDIRGKIKRADAKRAGQENTPNYKKWSSILRGLEHELDRHKAMLTSLEAETQQKTTRLKQVKEEQQVQLEGLKEKYDVISRMTPVEMMSLSAEDMAAFQEYERLMERSQRGSSDTNPDGETGDKPPAKNNPSTAQNDNQAKYVRVTEFKPQEKKPVEPPKTSTIRVTEWSKTAGEETNVAPPDEVKSPPSDAQEGGTNDTEVPTETVASTAPPAATEPPEATEPPQDDPVDPAMRRRQRFQSALQKSRQGDISSLTFEEAAILLTAYRKLTMHPQDHSGAAELEVNVSNTMWEVHARCARIVASWADLARRQSDAKR